MQLNRLIPTRRGTRPHLLFLAAFFPPSRASGVYRPLAMANYFVEHGWDVTVLTFTDNFYDAIVQSRDDSLVDLIDPRIDVRRVHLPIAHLAQDLRHYSAFRANFPRLHNKIHRSVVKMDRYATWLPHVMRAGITAHRGKTVDAILATGNPWTSFIAARGLHHVTGAPYVLDFRDAWTLNQFSQQPAFPPDHPAHTWERRCIESAAHTVFVNEGMKDWYAEKYPSAASRMLVVQNGYDAAAFTVDTFRPPSPEAPLRFGYIGTLTDQYDNRAFWEGWRLAQETPEVKGSTAHIYGHIGFFGTSFRTQSHGLPDADIPHVSYDGPVTKGEIAGTYRDLDVLLFLVPSSPYVTSGKTYEYMATGKPIVAVHAPDSAAGGPLAGYPLKASVAEMTPEAIRDAIVAAAKLARTATREQYDAARAHAATYDRARLLAPFEQEMRRLAATPGGHA